MRPSAFFRLKAGRRDGNHASVRDGLRKLGMLVVDTASCGDGVPDLCVIVRSAGPTWLELKVGKGKERASQVAWRVRAESFGVRVATVRSLDEALAAVRA